jgi:hypothetical protein
MQQFTNLLSLCQGLLTVNTVLPIRHAASLESFLCPWARAFAAVQPTSTVLHRGRLAGASAACLRSAANCETWISRRVPVLEPTMPFLVIFALRVHSCSLPWCDGVTEWGSKPLRNHSGGRFLSHPPLCFELIWASVPHAPSRARAGIRNIAHLDVQSHGIGDNAGNS